MIPLSASVASMLSTFPFLFQVQLLACALICSYRASISHRVSSRGTSSVSSVSLRVLIMRSGCAFLVNLPMKYSWFFHHGIAKGSPLSSRCRQRPSGMQNCSLPSASTKVRGSLVFSSNQAVMSEPAAAMMGSTVGRWRFCWTRRVRSYTSSKKDTQMSLGEQCACSSASVQQRRFLQGLATNFFTCYAALSLLIQSTTERPQPITAQQFKYDLVILF